MACPIQVLDKEWRTLDSIATNMVIFWETCRETSDESSNKQHRHRHQLRQQQDISKPKEQVHWMVQTPLSRLSPNEGPKQILVDMNREHSLDTQPDDESLEALKPLKIISGWTWCVIYGHPLSHPSQQSLR